MLQVNCNEAYHQGTHLPGTRTRINLQVFVIGMQVPAGKVVPPRTVEGGVVQGAGLYVEVVGDALDEGGGGGAAQADSNGRLSLVAGRHLQPAQQHTAAVSHQLGPCAHLPEQATTYVSGTLDLTEAVQTVARSGFEIQPAASDAEDFGITIGQQIGAIPGLRRLFMRCTGPAETAVHAGRSGLACLCHEGAPW